MRSVGEKMAQITGLKITGDCAETYWQQRSYGGIKYIFMSFNSDGDFGDKMADGDNDRMYRVLRRSIDIQEGQFSRF